MSEDRNLPDTAPADAAIAAEPAPRKPRRRRLWLLGGAAAVAAVTIAACAQQGRGPEFAEGWGGHHRGHGHGWHRGPMDTEEMARRVDKAVEWVLSDVGASAEQKTRVAEIAKQAIADLAPLRDAHRTARRQALDLFSAATIDAQAIEGLRAQQLSSADDASRRLTRALTEIAEVLTPEQRVQLRERIERRMSRRWS